MEQAPNKTKSMDSSWLLSSKPTSTSSIHITLGDFRFTLDRRLVARRSAMLAPLLNESPPEDVSKFKLDIPADEQAFEIVARFCHGLDVSLSNENIIPVICLAYHLQMTERHSSNNLLNKARYFFEQEILRCWNETIKSLRCIDHVVEQAMQLRLIDACSESLTRKALADPDLLGPPCTELAMDAIADQCQTRHGSRTSARRRLFVRDSSKSEELTSLPVHIYEPIVERMIQGGVVEEYVTGNLCQYVKKRVCSDKNIERKSRREVIEAVERLLSCNKGLLPCSLLFELLNIAIDLDASFRCRNGIEIRIGKQLDQATVKDLIIPNSSLCSSKELLVVEHDVESLRRIVQSYYANYTSPNNPLGLVKVAKLMEDFLAGAARELDLKNSEFITLAEISASASAGAGRCLDGIYRAVDVYLERHQHLTESEKEDVCGVLECHKLSHEACDHAAQNQRLPLRTIVQVLFLNQLQLRDVITKDQLVPPNIAEESKRVREDDSESMSKKLLETEEHKEMDGHSCHCHGRIKKDKVSLWQEMKRKFGCLRSTHECNCQVKKRKKVHP
ncbi:hypothetical protein Dimus_003750 [Dionaea muscipula]